MKGIKIYLLKRKILRLQKENLQNLTREPYIRNKYPRDLDWFLSYKREIEQELELALLDLELILK